MKKNKGRETNGKIKIGQRWKKKDTGRIMQITGKGNAGKYRCCFEKGKVKMHALNERVIYAYYEKL